MSSTVMRVTWAPRLVECALQTWLLHRSCDWRTLMETKFSLGPEWSHMPMARPLPCAGSESQLNPGKRWTSLHVSTDSLTLNVPCPHASPVSPLGFLSAELRLCSLFSVSMRCVFLWP